MPSFFAFALIAALTLGLTGCETPRATKMPSRWLMAAPCALPPVPEKDGDPVVGATHEGELRKCAANRKDQVLGLQRYARAAVSK